MGVASCPAVTKTPIFNCIFSYLKIHIFWTRQDINMKFYMKLEDDKLEVLIQFCAKLYNRSAVFRD